MTRSRIYVLAGTHAEYQAYLREQHLTPKDAIFLRRPEQLSGLRDIRLARTGTWRELPNLAAIEHEILKIGVRITTDLVQERSA